MLVLVVHILCDEYEYDFVDVSLFDEKNLICRKIWAFCRLRG